ncbi:MAG: PAS domain S-box protein, partial [Proteobacteria bacterium]|nr:PAS domain S-box protein [Pseudomonadota bacterium]
MVIAMDNPALEFAIDNQAELFGNAPIVFCGINNYTPSLLKGRSEVTGIVEAVDLAGTIEVMLRLHATTQEIFSPHDYTVSGLALRKELEALIPRFGAKVRFRFTDPLTMEELLKELERLPGDSLVLPISFITDKSGRTFGMTEAARLFSEHSPVPLYSIYEQRLGFGIVGGKLLSARIHGTNAARIALRVLAGEKASAIPVVFESDSQFMFDYTVMKRFGIPLSALLENSTMINKPVSFNGEVRHLQVFRKDVLWDGERQLQTVYQDITERKQAEEELRASEEKYRIILENIEDGYFEVDLAGNFTFFNPSLCRILGYPGEEMPSMNNRVYMDAENAKKVFRAFNEVYVTGIPSKGFEWETIRKDGARTYMEVSVSLIARPGEKPTGFRGIARDITERKKAEEEIQASREQMRALAGRLQAVREEERTNIAREIHDELGGALTGLKIDFSLLTRAALKIKNETVRTSLLAGMDSITKFIDATIHTVRRIAMELRPGVLDDLGLVAALEWQLNDFQKRTGIRCEFFPSAEDISLDADLSTALFRIFQEALTNVARHSGATEV